VTDHRDLRRVDDVVRLGRAIQAITLDFGNTLVPFPAGPMADVVLITAARVAGPLRIAEPDFVRYWGEERTRQFAEDVPNGREADMDVRAARVLARLRGVAAPAAEERWDDVAAVTASEPDEIEAILETYSDVFAEVTPVPPEIGPLLERLAGEYPLALLSNWPIARAIDRFLETAGWTRHFKAVVVSQRVGSIKPWPEIFLAAAHELAVTSGPRMLHVGDDLNADVVGAHGVGWRAAWVSVKPEDSPLPTAPRVTDATPDITLRTVMDLERAVGMAGRGSTGRIRRGG
jgi:HAD superfamily hydrolase (TIGR01549 family)